MIRHGVMVRLSLVVVDLFYPVGGGVLVGRNALLDKWVRSLADGIIYYIDLM
jgi:hypothetical protein